MMQWLTLLMLLMNFEFRFLIILVLLEIMGSFVIVLKIVTQISSTPVHALDTVKTGHVNVIVLKV